ncbi:Ribosomal large subunit pseudouridine synthase D [Candidatus Entotheonellaceae bacterium PAL068K]
MQTHRLQVAAGEAGTRLDKYLVTHLPDLSRSRLQRLIQEGTVYLARRQAAAGLRLREGDCLTVRVPPPPSARPAAEAIPLGILYEDEALVVVNKPPGIVVHPAPGHYHGTLVNALLSHCRNLSGVGGEVRPGIVHRLDKDTSGVLLVAKHDRSHQHLAAQLKARQLQRRYVALVRGRLPTPQGTIDAPIGRHPRQRHKMAVVRRTGRTARTHYQVVAVWGPVSLLRLRLETGRTHQIRVHLTHLGYPVVGDTVYGATSWHRPAGPELERALRAFSRQALHAERVRFQHPDTGTWLTCSAPVPEDMESLIAQLRCAYGETAG